jgi:hypothetical protein
MSESPLLRFVWHRGDLAVVEPRRVISPVSRVVDALGLQHDETGEFAAKGGDGSAAWGSAKGVAWLRANAERYKSDPEFRAACQATLQFTCGDYAGLRALSAGQDEYEPKGEIVQHTSEWADKPMGKVWFDGGLDGHAFPEMLDPATVPFAWRDGYVNGIKGAQGTLPFDQTARDGVTALAKFVDNAPVIEDPIYRGMCERFSHYGEAEDRQRPIPAVGDVMDIKGLTSFTRSQHTADTFASGTGGGSSRQPDREWLLEVHGARGIDVAALSPWRQQEVIARGSFRVQSVQHEQATAYTPPWSSTPIDYPTEFVRVVLQAIP